MSQYPIIKYVLIFISGLIFQNQSNISITTLIWFLSVVFGLMLLLHILKESINLNIRLILSFFFVFLLGCMHGSIFSKNIVYPLDSPKIRKAKVEGEVSHISLMSKNKLELELRINCVNDSIYLHDENSIFLCNIWKDTSCVLDSFYNELKLGHTLIVEGTISKPKNRRNPGEFDYQKYLGSKGISGIVNCYSPKNVLIIDSSRISLNYIIPEIRKKIYGKIRKLHSESSTSLLKGVLLADRSDIDYDVKESFIKSGVIHVLALSGLHVGFISMIFYLLLGRFNIRIKYLGTIAGILIFLLITGGHASVFRATMMAIIYLMAKLLNRSTNGICSISITALIILLIKPEELYNPGFQLSFSAVLSILILYPLLSEKVVKLNLSDPLKKTLLFMIVSLSAQLGTLPLTIFYFKTLSLISIFANLLVIPAIGIVVALGIFTIIVSIFSVWTAAFFAGANDLIIQALFIIIQFTSKMQISSIDISNYSVVDVLLLYPFLAIALFIAFKFKRKLLMMILIPIIYLSFLNFSSLDDADLLPDGILSVLMIDVGQGDAIYIKFPNGKSAIIDAGNSTRYFDNGERVIFPLLTALKEEKIDYGFVSHLDSDHLGGFFALLERGMIDTIYKPLDEHSINDSIFEEYLSNQDINLRYYSNKIFKTENCRIYILNDTSSVIFKNFEGNNKSGIIKIIYGDNSFLFVGDAEREAEQFLVKRFEGFLQSDVLKVGHHGSETSSSEELLNAVAPSIAIISAEVKNKFNHPSKIVLDRLEKRDISIMRTDLEGAVILCSNGKEIYQLNWR